MTGLNVLELIAAILLVNAVIWIPVVRWMTRKGQILRDGMVEECRRSGERMVIGPQSCLYRGADSVYGNIKGNGVVCLTDKRVVFEKLTGQRIAINRTDIAGVSEERWFRGKTAFGTGASGHLVFHTADGNRVGFLIKDTKRWVRELQIHDE
ncbi:MAG: hypothetical protein AB1500_01600 [Bacillota bacterium]